MTNLSEHEQARLDHLRAQTAMLVAETKEIEAKTRVLLKQNGELQ